MHSPVLVSQKNQDPLILKNDVPLSDTQWKMMDSLESVELSDIYVEGSPLTLMPSHVINHIFDFMSMRELGACQGVDKRWKLLAVTSLNFKTI